MDFQRIRPRRGQRNRPSAVPSNPHARQSAGRTMPPADRQPVIPWSLRTRVPSSSATLRSMALCLTLSCRAKSATVTGPVMRISWRRRGNNIGQYAPGEGLAAGRQMLLQTCASLQLQSHATAPPVVPLSCSNQMTMCTSPHHCLSMAPCPNDPIWGRGTPGWWV